jgi:hypothetical protein
MKRAPLLRKTPLRSKSRLVSRTQLKATATLARGKEMKRTRMKQKPPTPRTAEQGGDEAYLDFVRGLPCCVYGTAAPSHAHHETGNGRGKGQKAHDRRTMPMSARAHREFHDGKGYFEYWTAEARRIWQDIEIQRVQALHAAYQAGTRFTEVA